jgi:hypothetical protein
MGWKIIKDHGWTEEQFTNYGIKSYSANKPKDIRTARCKSVLGMMTAIYTTRLM